MQSFNVMMKTTEESKLVKRLIGSAFEIDGYTFVATKSIGLTLHCTLAGCEMKKQRLMLGMSQRQVEDALNIPRASVSRLERSGTYKSHRELVTSYLAGLTCTEGESDV